MKNLMLIVGILAALLGLYWIGQGLGWFGLGAPPSIYYGVVTAIIGIGLIAYSRRN